MFVREAEEVESVLIRYEADELNEEMGRRPVDYQHLV